MHYKYSNPKNLCFSYDEINSKIINHFNPDYFLHFGSPTDTKDHSKTIYKEWLYNSKRLLKLFIKTNKNNYFINIGSIKELLNKENFFYTNKSYDEDLYSYYKYKFSSYLNKEQFDNTNTHNIYLLPIFGKNIFSGLIYNSCKAIIKDKLFKIKSKNSIRSFLYINDLLLGITTIMLNKNRKIHNTILKSDQYETIEQIMTKQFKLFNKIKNLELVDNNSDNFSDMSKILTSNYRYLKLNNFTKFDKGFKETITWLLENE